MNPFDFVKNYSALQEQLKGGLDKVAAIHATGSSGGNMVQVTLNGKLEVTDIHLDPICVDNRDVKMLEDLIRAAHHDALEKIQSEIKNELGPVVSALNLNGMNS